MTPLSPKRRSELRAEAHKLNPVVIIGDKGLTDEVIAEIDRSLRTHELIKVRAAAGERDARDVWLETICERLQAHPVQQIGKVFVLFRENPEAEEPQRERRRTADTSAPRAGVVTERGKSRQRSRDMDKQRAADVKDMIRKGKIKPKVETRPAPEPAEDATPRRRPRTSR